MIHSAATPIAGDPRDPRDRHGAFDPACVLERLPAGVVVLDGAGRVRECNPAAVELLGAPLAGQPWQDVVRRAFAPHGVAPRAPVLRDGRRVRVATRALAPEPGQIVLLAEDTEAPGREPSATAAETAAVLAHQLRTPLAAARLYAGHMQRPLLETQDRLRIAGKLLAALRHLERLVNDMLIFARAGELEKKPLAVSRLLDELRELAEPLLSELSCTLACQNQAPQAVILGHRDALLSALQNLVVNAAQACGPGGRLHLAVRPQAEGAIEIVLRDNGPGIPAGMEERLFEPFFTTRANGTGLGLAVVRAVARAHGGEAHYAPHPAGGAQFLVTIPLAGEETHGRESSGPSSALALHTVQREERV